MGFGKQNISMGVNNMDKPEHKSCPFCGEEIRIKAKKCIHCKTYLPIENEGHKNIEEQISNNDDNEFLEKDNVDLIKEGGKEPVSNEVVSSETNSEAIQSYDNDHNVEMMSKGDSYKIIAVISYAFCALFVGIGFHKLFFYNNPESYIEGNPVNAYVGGDAYNFIINANYATAYFTLAIFFAVIGMTAILCFLNREKSQMKPAQ